ncbi:MAG: AMP-binding enzyme, partial [Desulfomonilaceae bacterium]
FSSFTVPKMGQRKILTKYPSGARNVSINVYPAEVENILKKNEEIVDSAVIGIPDEKWGEAVKAVVVKRPDSAITENDVIEFCRKYLAGFKIPKSVDFVDQVPRSFVGKALKKELRKKYWEGRDRQI